ncbi:hypothetical protein TSMEX_000943 [Taenia solium]|eukprot:TsM_000741500 transcript=TsM_000741500 gene=TsM_000741500
MEKVGEAKSKSLCPSNRGKGTLLPKRTHSSTAIIIAAKRFLLNNQKGVNGGKRKGQEGTDLKRKPLDRDKQYAVDRGEELEQKHRRRGDQQLSFLGALVAQSALHRFLAPHKGLFSKLNLRQFSRLCE